MPGNRLAALATARWWWVFASAGLFFMAFGVTSFGLFQLLSANLALFARYGLMAAFDGGLLQLLQLLSLGYLSLLFWVGFKTCEGWLVRRLGG